MIYEALTKLIGHQSFGSIKVSQVVEEAQIGRATFYRNFDMLEDVLRWRADQVVEQLVIYVAEYRLSQTGSSTVSVLKPVLRFFYLHSSIVELLIAANQIDILQKALQAKLEQATPKSSLSDLPSEYLKYGPVIRSSVAVHILAHWIKGGKKEAPDELADSLREMAIQLSGLGMLF